MKTTLKDLMQKPLEWNPYLGVWIDPQGIIYEEVNGEVIEPKNKKAIKDAFISQKIGLVMSECGEALEAMRRFEYEANGYGIGVKDSFADEIADAIIRLLDLCGELNINIDAQIQWKMDYNNGRSEKHGKEF